MALTATRVAGASAAALAVFALPTGATANGAPGTRPEVGGFSAIPARYNPREPITQSYFREHVSAGQTLRDEVRVANSSRRTVRLLVYPVDGVTAVTPGAVYSNRGQALHKAGRWLAPEVGQVELAPGEKRLVSFTLRVPFTRGRATTSRASPSRTPTMRALAGASRSPRSCAWWWASRSSSPVSPIPSSPFTASP